MGNYAIPYMLEKASVDDISGSSWVDPLGVTIVDALGADKIVWPAIRVATTSGTERPENSGNFLCSVSLTVLGTTDPEVGDGYSNARGYHDNICGAVHQYITGTLTISGLHSATYDTNDIEIYDVRYSGFSRSIDEGAGAFEDTFDLEIYLRETTA